MAKTIKPNSFFKTFQFLFLSSLLMGSNLVALSEPAANTLPSGYQVQGGNVTFDNSVSNILNVNSSTNASIVNYQSFSIGRDSIVNLNLPSSSSAILNRVVGSNVSEIFGQMNSNGRVFLVNPSGILFGTGSQVNVGSLFASTLGINDNDFLNGIYVFKNTGSPSFIINNGSLKGVESINLFAGAINNTGSIEAPVVNLAVGDKITASLGGGVSVDVVVNDELKQKVNGFNDAISNSGSIKGAFVNLKTNLESGIYENAVNNSGLVKASSLLDILGQTQNTVQETQTITETVINDNGTPANTTDDFSEQVQKQVLVDKVETSSDGTVKNSTSPASLTGGALLEGGSLKIEAGVLENNPNSTIQSTIGNIDIQLSGSKTASVAPLDNTLVHNGSSPPTQRVFGYSYVEISPPYTFLKIKQPGVVQIGGKYYVQTPVLNETISYSLLNKGTIQSANDLNIKSTNGPIINRSGSNWNASLKSANDMTLDAPNILNQRGGFYTTYRYQLNKSSNNDYYEWWTDQAPGTNASIDAGNDLKIKQGNFSNQSGSIKVGNNLDFTGTNFSNLTKVLQQTEHHHWTKRGIIRRFDRDTWYINSARGPMASLYVEKDANFGTLSNPMNNFTNTGLIDVGNFNANGSGNFVNGITDRNIQNPDGQIPGTISSRGDFRLNAESYDIPIGTFLNTGFIEADETVKIKAQKIQNVRRTARAIDNVLTSKGFFNDKKMKQIEYEQLQSGGEIRGHNIELIASEEFVNRGGIISAETFPTESSAKNYLLAVMNDPELVREAGTLKISAPKIVNEVAEGEKVVSWDNGNLGDFLGMKNWDKASVYAPGQLVSDGTITLEATNKDNTGTVINRGSDIIANGDIKIKADKLVEQDWVASHHTVSDKIELKGLKITRDKETAHVTRGSTIASTEGNINIEVGNESTDGTFRNTASDVLANKNIDISAKNIEISDAIHQSMNEHDSLALNFKAPSTVSLDFQSTDYTVTTHQSSNLIAGGNLTLNSGSRGNITVTGSNLEAGNQISLTGKDVTIQNGLYTDTSKTVGGGTYTTVNWGSITGGVYGFNSDSSFETLTPSTLFAKDISINAGNQTNIFASILGADNSLNITTPNLNIRGEYQRANSETTNGGFSVTYIPPNMFSVGVNGGYSYSKEGQYFDSILNAPNLNLNSPNQSIDGANINGQEINPHSDYSDSHSYSFSFAAGSAGVSAGVGFDDFSLAGGVGKSDFVSVGYKQFSLGAGNSDNRDGSHSTNVFGGAYGVGFGLSKSIDNPGIKNDHPIWTPSISYGPLGIAGSFQHGELKTVNYGVGLWQDGFQVNAWDPTCFKAGTPITLVDGSTKAIEIVKAGDKVLSWNENTGKLESKTVLNAFRKTTEQIVQIQLADKLIETTPDHPFYVQSKGWVEAGKLNINDKLFDEEHKLVSIVSLKTVDEIVPVYNLEIEDNHTYFAHGILVHNKECTLNGKITLNGKSYNITNGEKVTDSTGRELSPVEVYELARANKFSDPDSSKSLINSLSNADLIQLADRYYEIFHLNDKTIGTNWTALGNTNNIIETLDARFKQNPESLTFDDITQLSRIKALFQIDATDRGHIILNVGFGAVGVASELKAAGGAAKLKVGKPVDPYAPGWDEYYAQNPHLSRSLGAAAADDFNLVYENNPKHPPFNSTVNKNIGGNLVSNAPKNPDSFLNNSIKISPSLRVNVDKETGNFIVFRAHAPNTFHGYTSTWQDLPQTMKNALIEAKLVNVRGKIK